jgi:hypothetical protein
MQKVLERNTVYVFEYAIAKDNKIWLYNDYDSYRRGFSLNDGKSLWKPKLMIDENNLLHIIGYGITWYFNHYKEFIEDLDVIPREEFIKEDNFITHFKWGIIPQREKKKYIGNYSWYMEKENENKEVKLLLSNFKIIIL